MGTNVDELRRWLDDQVSGYTRARPYYERLGVILTDTLQRAAGRISPHAIVQARAKTIASFAGKAVLKREKYRHPLTELTDLCGARVIVRTRSEVLAFCEFVKRHFEVDWENSMDTSERLRPEEFGYRSVHFIVSLQPGVDYGLAVPDELWDLKAEIQVRTFVEHAFADFSHDLSYKGAFTLPSAWARELARAAAALEGADQTFSEIEERLRAYAVHYGEFLDEPEARAEMERLEITLEHDPDNEDLAQRLGKLAITRGDWDRAVDVLSPFVDMARPEDASRPILRDLGVALCKKYRAQPESEGCRRGRCCLELAAAEAGMSERGDSSEAGVDVDALASLAGAWKGIDDDQVREYYRRAFEADPRDPYALGNYLEQELQQNPALLATARPLVRDAADRCRAHEEVGVNMPWALYDLGKFLLLLGDPFAALDAYCRALTVSSAAFMVEGSLDSLDRLARAGIDVTGIEWARRLLLLGRAARFPTPESLESVRVLATRDVAPLAEPILIVAGDAASPPVEKPRHAALLETALARFRGTIVSGGTTQGVAGVVGNVGEGRGAGAFTVGYVPGQLPAGVPLDDDPRRYAELRRTDGTGFSPLEPLQYWLDLLAAGVSPENVRMLGVGGGHIAGAEYRMALALGATVGILDGSGREAGRVLSDARWSTCDSLVRLPGDPAILEAFADPGSPTFPAAPLEHLAREIHDSYRRSRRSGRLVEDPAMADWSDLPDDLKESNRGQALDILNKLERVGFEPREGAGPSPDESSRFTDEEVEVMARREHARFVVERLLARWRPGPTRDPARKTSPFLVPWEDLDEDVKDLDRQAVRQIPRLLASAGMNLVRA